MNGLHKPWILAGLVACVIAAAEEDSGNLHRGPDGEYSRFLLRENVSALRRKAASVSLKRASWK